MNGYEAVELTRDVDAVLIPTGVPIRLEAGTEVAIFQSLGDSYTININGNLARIAGGDADALGKEAQESPPLIPSPDTPEGEVDVDINKHPLFRPATPPKEKHKVIL